MGTSNVKFIFLMVSALPFFSTNIIAEEGMRSSTGQVRVGQDYSGRSGSRSNSSGPLSRSNSGYRMVESIRDDAILYLSGEQVINIHFDSIRTFFDEISLDHEAKDRLDELKAMLGYSPNADLSKKQKASLVLLFLQKDALTE